MGASQRVLPLLPSVPCWMRSTPSFAPPRGVRGARFGLLLLLSCWMRSTPSFASSIGGAELELDCCCYYPVGRAPQLFPPPPSPPIPPPPFSPEQPSPPISPPPPPRSADAADSAAVSLPAPPISPQLSPPAPPLFPPPCRRTRRRIRLRPGGGPAMPPISPLFRVSRRPDFN